MFAPSINAHARGIIAFFLLLCLEKEREMHEGIVISLSRFSFPFFRAVGNNIVQL